MSALLMKIPEAENVIFEITDSTGGAVDVPFTTLVASYLGGDAQVKELQARVSELEADLEAANEDLLTTRRAMDTVMAELATSKSVFSSLLDGLKKLIGATP